MIKPSIPEFHWTPQKFRFYAGENMTKSPPSLAYHLTLLASSQLEIPEVELPACNL